MRQRTKTSCCIHCDGTTVYGKYSRKELEENHRNLIASGAMDTLPKVPYTRCFGKLIKLTEEQASDTSLNVIYL